MTNLVSNVDEKNELKEYMEKSKTNGKVGRQKVKNG